MNKHVLMLMFCTLAVGCVEGAGAFPDEKEVEVINVPKITSNALTPTQLWNSSLVSGSLTTTNLQTMAATADGRATLHYAIACALDDHQSVSVNVGGTVYTYEGFLDIAGTWTTTALSSDQQQQVSACILALVNLTGTAMDVSLRSGSLGLDSGETTTYSVEEGAFWGNMFLGGSSWAAACNGIDQADRDIGNALPLRECAEDSEGSPGTTPCGFVFAGLCTSACGDSNWYGDCYDGVNTATSNVVTTYVIP